MAIPDFQTLMLPVLAEAAKGEARISDVVGRLADQFSLSLEERSHLLPSGRQTTFADRVHWAKSYLGEAGLFELTAALISRLRGADLFQLQWVGWPDESVHPEQSLPACPCTGCTG